MSNKKFIIVSPLNSGVLLRINFDHVLMYYLDPENDDYVIIKLINETIRVRNDILQFDELFEL